MPTKIQYVLLVLSLLCLTLFPSFLTARPVVFRGKVINASKDSAAVGNITVKLLQFKHGDMSPKELMQTRALANGRFYFQIKSPDSLMNYYASVDYQGLRYYSSGAHFHTGISEQIGNVVVYDTSNVASSLQTMMHHIFIDDLGRTLQVREMHIISNAGQYAVMNAASDGQGRKATFIFKLSASARNFRNLSTQRDIIHEGQYVYDRSVALPGNVQISFAYEVPWHNNTAEVNIDVPQTTRTVDVFVSNPQINIISEQLHDLGPFAIRDVQYHRYGVKNLQAGSSLRLRIRRSTFVKESPLTTIVLTSLLLIIALIYATLKSSKPTMTSVRKADLKKRKSELIEKIAGLDANPEMGSNPELEQERQKLFDELEAIEIELQSHKKSTKK